MLKPFGIVANPQAKQQTDDERDLVEDDETPGRVATQIPGEMQTLGHEFVVGEVVSRRDVDVLSCVGREHVLLKLDQTVAYLRAVDEHGEDRAEKQIVDERRAPVDLPVELMKNEEVNSIQLALERMNAVEGEQTREIVDDDQGYGVRAQDLDGEGEVPVPAVHASERTREDVVVVHVRGALRFQST